MANIRTPKDYTKKVFRSVHNRSTIRRATLHAGIGVPIYSRRVMAGEKVFIDPVTVLQTNALQAPLMGSFTLQLAVYFDSDSNYYGWMDNNARLSTEQYLSRVRHSVPLHYILGVGSSDKIKLQDYLKNVRSSEGSYFVKKHSLLEFAGYSAGTMVVEDDGRNPFPDYKMDLGFILTYLNIFRNYYCNNQEDNFPYIGSNLWSEKNPYKQGELSVLDKLFKELRFQDDGYDFANSPNSSALPGMYWFKTQYLPSLANGFGGLWLATYKPDLMVNLLNSTNAVKSYVRVEDGQFTIDTLRFQNKLQRLIDRIDVSGGRFSNWLRAVWGVKTRKDMDIPEMIGVTQKLIDPTELSAKSNSPAVGDRDAQYLGDLGGNFNKTDGHRGHSFYASTSGRVMVIATIIPNVDYCQGIDWETEKVSFADDYTPEFSQLGFQKVPVSRYSSLPFFAGGLSDPSFDPLSTSVGKQVAWLEEMTDVNRNYGEFSWAGYYNYWVLNRLYSSERPAKVPLIDPSAYNFDFQPFVTQYIDPLLYQYPFVAQSIKDPNWFLQCGLRIKSVRPIGKRFMPNLE